eukprot:gene5260-18495_t
MGHSLSGEFLDASVGRLCELQASQGLNMQNVAMTLWACATMNYKPADGHMSTLAAAATQQLPTASHIEMAQVAWAFCQLDTRPPDSFLLQLVKSSEANLETFSYLSLATILQALAKMQYPPPDAWLDRAAALAAALHQSPFLGGLAKGRGRRPFSERQRERLRESVRLSLKQLGYQPLTLDALENNEVIVRSLSGNLAQYSEFFASGSALLLGLGSALLWG